MFSRYCSCAINGNNTEKKIYMCILTHDAIAIDKDQ